MASVTVIYAGIWHLWLSPGISSLAADDLEEAMAIINMESGPILKRKLRIMHSDSKGKIESYSHVLINDIVPSEGLKTKLEDGDTIKLVPIIVGG